MTPSAAFSLGLRSVMPLLLGVAPFGVIYGVVALQSGISPLAAMAMSSIVFAGSAQFLLAQLVGAGAPLLLTAGAVGLVNLRHALYSASVAPILAHLPRRWKVLLAYLLTDEAYAAAIPHMLAGREGGNSPHAHWILFGSGFGLWSGWQVATLAGVLIGAQLPADLGLDFALPLTFIAIVVPMIDSRALLASALTAGAVAVVLAALPYKLGLFVAALAGLAVGALLTRNAA
ncbi:putative branched-chain amino acid permease (azaleucine resistance) [Sulfuritalea hydrogenivorans sk43H]|uniref:Putative branched-chain amino acid permease (Azaleucine resistance) n=2 Tax=Sulfuritalea hydrogenivorans TaxID=748811 RepID=W0SJ38_9PROT|nr:putative branched-chain amino acid permease (azaleucine resistance) [Sulfuritalea hydrogenivorans sk43H]